METIETEKLLLRPLEAADAEQYHSLMVDLRNDPETKEWVGVTKVLSVEAYADRLGKGEKMRSWDFAAICKRTGGFAGICGFISNAFITVPELYVWLVSDSRGKELGPDAAKGLINAAFLGSKWDVVIGVPHPQNTRSIRLLAKVDMQHRACIVDRNEDDWSVVGRYDRFPVYCRHKNPEWNHL